ncbi:MAG: D-2-hydroxyacid dehydrogenase [Clostridia bacterium]|nr:D-2-hydroxyacid dehydrogenase [Clostridia bacterium]
MKIVVLDGYAANPGDISWEQIAALGELEVHDYTAPQDTLSRIGDAEIVLTNKVLITREIIENAPNLKYIGVLATGFNIIDQQAARERGIPVCNVPTYATEAVAQFVFALLLEFCHHVGHHNAQVQKMRWTNNRDFCFWDYPLMELQGKTMGLVGLGRIGQATKKLAEAFGMKVLCCRSTPDAPGCVPLETLLRESDIVSLHCPLTEKTRHIINAETIGMMKDGVIIINTGRGPLIDDAALRDALVSGKVYGAAVDVATVEPIPADNPLLGLDNCIITPHIAWATDGARQRLMDTVAENIRAFLAGTPVNVVNP